MDKTLREECKNCIFFNNAYVPPEYPFGDEKIDVLFIGEAPGVEEERLGKPFVGRSGQLFRDALAEFIKEFPHLKFGITNVVKCHPPNNMTPKSAEIKLCKPLLLDEIEKYDPDFIIPLGNTALQAIVGRAGIQKNLNQVITKVVAGRERTIIPTFHPAAILRNPHLLQDFVRTFGILEKIMKGQVLELEDFIVVDDFRKIENMLNDLSNSKAFAFDLETSSLNPFSENAKILCLSLSNGKNTYVIPAKDYEMSNLIDLLKIVFSLPAKKIAHNAKFDVKWLKVFGVEVKNLAFDTMIAHYLINENLPHSLAFILSEMGFVDHKGDFSRAVGGETATWKVLSDEEKLNEYWDVLLEYNAKDAWSTYLIYEKLKDKLESSQVWLMENFYIPLIYTFSEIEIYGMKVDLNRIQYLSQKYKNEMKKIISEMENLSSVKFWKTLHPDEKFNPSSTKQVAEIIFDIEKLEVIAMTPKGAPSTKSEFLEFLASKSKFVKLLLEYRKIMKNETAFIKGIQKHIKIDGCVHPSYNLIGTVTGRISCREPNIQQIPKDSEIRTIFVPKLDWFIEADFSQIELRVAASLSGDPYMIDAYKKGEDLHTKTASSIFGKRPEEVSEEERFVAKTINFGILYGMGAKSLQARVSREGINIPLKKAEEYIRKFFIAYPVLKAWVDEQKSKVLGSRMVVSPFGRIRRLMGTSDDDLRQGVNAPVQGTASDLTLFSVMFLHNEFKRRGLKSHIVGSVHDSILFDVADEELHCVVTLIKQIMEGLDFDFIKVPLKVDVAIGKAWGEILMEV